MSRVGLISDMHGNAVALEAVLADAERQRVDEIVSLGDVAQGGPQPVECLEILRRLECRCVLGNSDEFLLTLDLGAETLDEERREQIFAIGRWSQEQLGEDDRLFLRSFEPTVEIDLDGLRLVCCHGSPRSNEQIVLPETPADEVRELIGDADVVAGGHVHLQWLLRLGEKAWLCVGSVGLVYDHTEPLDDQPFHPVAEYAVVAEANGTVGIELRRVPFDVQRLLAAIDGSGMPDAEQLAARWKLS